MAAKTQSPRRGRDRAPALADAPQTELQSAFRWDDARVLLALHRSGTLSGAASLMGVDASTVGRRIDALEASLGARLFERTPDGALATPAADALMPHAEAMEHAANELAGRSGSFERAVEGEVRISVPPGVADFYVAPALLALTERYPRLRIELDARVGYVDLARREADLALRGVRPERGDLVAVRVAHARSVPFVSAALAERLGRVRELAAIPWINYGRELSHIPDARWVEQVAAPGRVLLRTSSFAAQVAAAETGLGALLAAEPLIQMRPTLTPLSFARSVKLPPLPEGSLWLVAHRASRSVPRIAAVWEHLVATFAAPPTQAQKPRARSPRAKRSG